MRILEVQQGSAAWHSERARRFTASEAPAMMGASKYTSRAALLKQKATGLAEEVTPQKQALFDRGHATEASARAIVEEMLGEDLFPATAVHDDDDSLLASFDGVTMLEDVIYEHKLWSEDLARQVRAGELDPHYFWQLEQQLLVSGAERALFVCSNGTREQFVHMEYRPVLGRREALLAGWKQFAADLAAYVPPATSHIEKIVAEPVEALPAPVVQVTGQLALKDNFKVFEQRLRDFLDNRLIREPKSDQDFIDLDAQIKAMKQAREALGAAEAQMLAQVQPVDQAKKTKDMLDKLLQQNLSMAERLLKDEKERRRGDIVAGGMKALADHIAALNARLGKSYMPQVPADFGGCVKGLKSLASMEDKVATELARAKIAANEIADRIDANLKALRELASEYRTLFADAATLVLKAPEDCRAVITARIAEHKDAEEKRAAELAEQQREKIRAEEVARLEREQQAREAAARAEEQRKQREAEEAQRRQQAEKEVATRGQAQERQLPPADPDPFTAPNVVPMRNTPSPAAAQPATLTLGVICIRFGFTMTADFVRRLGIEPAATEKAAKLYTEAQFQLICEALVAHVRTAQAKQEAA